ncbi:MAG: magnesium transporter CorA family protein [Proteobacteria bacterium]|nr:magnesium transporter CorA family protein [Pseudomonadota bacterium]
MIEFWKCARGFKQIEQWEPDAWVLVTQPEPEELERLEEQFKVPLDYIHDVEDQGERPRIDTDEGWFTTILRIPDKFVDEDGEVAFATRPMAVLIREDVAITVCWFRPEMIDDLIQFSNRKQIAERKGLDFISTFFVSSAVWFLRYLKLMNQKMEDIEDALEKSMDNEELRAMMRIEKYLVYFITTLRGNEVVLERFKRMLPGKTYDEDLLEDASIELHQAYSTANIYSDILERQREAYSSIITNNLNAVMQRLTVITLILMLPACVSGFLGMNVMNGIETWPFAFPAIFGLTVLICVVAYYMLKRRRML